MSIFRFRRRNKPQGPLALAAPQAGAEAVPIEYNGFPTMIHYFINRHEAEIKALMEAHGVQGAPQPILVAKLVQSNPEFKAELLELIDLLKTAHGYDGREQYDGYESFDAWRDNYDSLKGKKATYDKPLGGNDSGKKRRSASDIMDIIGKGISITSGAISGGLSAAGQLKGLKGAGGDAGSGNAAPDGSGGGPAGDGFFDKYKMYIIGGVVLLVAAGAAFFLLKKK